MAASSLAMIGAQGGACAHQCSHLDCISIRVIAEERCRVCKLPIGFDSPFYTEPDAKIHAPCLERELAKKLKAGLPHSDIHFLTVEEAAEFLRIEPDTLRNWVSQERIPFRKAGGRVLFLLEELLNWTLPPARSKVRTRPGLILPR